MMATAPQTRAYGSGNVMMMRNESSTADTLVAMLASCGAQGGMQGPHCAPPRSVGGGLEDAVMGGGQKRYYPMYDNSDEIGDEDAADDGAQHVEKKRRLTVDQVRSLEKNFEQENKLEPERKLQLAKELGLQPRQVAVWFQNRRARWKTKQLERDYDVLKMDYDALQSKFDSIVADKEKLQAEIIRLNGKLQAQSTTRKLDGSKPFDTEDLDVTTMDLGTHLEMPVRPESGTQQQQQQQQVGQESYQQQQQVQQSSTAGVQSKGSPGMVKSKEGGSTSSDESNSSEIMNADSPHPIDSGLSAGASITIDQKSPAASTFMCTQSPAVSTFMCNQLQPPSAVDMHNLEQFHVQFAEDMCSTPGSRQLVTPGPFQRIAIKTEDGTVPSNLLQEECSNYFYATMDETGWWDWP